MDKMVKLLKKVNRKNRERLLLCVEALERGELGTLRVKKIIGSSLYRVRVGDFRIIFSVDAQTKRVVVESIRLRNEQTYK